MRPATSTRYGRIFSRGIADDAGAAATDGSADGREPTRGVASHPPAQRASSDDESDGTRVRTTAGDGADSSDDSTASGDRGNIHNDITNNIINYITNNNTINDGGTGFGSSDADCAAHGDVAGEQRTSADGSGEDGNADQDSDDEARRQQVTEAGAGTAPVHGSGSGNGATEAGSGRSGGVSGRERRQVGGARSRSGVKPRLEFRPAQDNQRPEADTKAEQATGQKGEDPGSDAPRTAAVAVQTVAAIQDDQGRDEAE